ncbi:MAG: asparagine synthase (glutamine-hydrolyzing) [Sandaracinaceae bacterium]|nr:asparagine synthase (glutamine-hydrolyzing) [Sandaracinaceae bacterium]
MCGVVAILRLGERPLPEASALERMGAALAHRGPDDWGAYADPHVLLGATRLALVGVEGGAQPHRGARPGTVAVVNGEIYDHVALRAELDRPLDDPCDTAVVPHLYDAHGEDFVARLHGMFAIALWDAAERRLLLARDRLGIKPLFVAQTRDFLVVASEAKAIFASGLVRAAIDRDALDDLFSFGYPFPPRSMFEGVRALRPGHVALAQPGAALAERAYASLPLVPKGAHRRGSVETIAGELREVLREAVRDHLMGDVELGAMVSGGLDSSAIAALAREVRGRPLDAFSLAFAGPMRERFDESRHAAEVAARLGARAELVTLSEASAARLPEMIWALELPLIVPGAIGGLALAEAERARGRFAVLSGDGADELLGGYDVFKAARLRRGLGALGLEGAASTLIGLAARASGQPRGLGRAIAPRASRRAVEARWGIAPPWLGAWQLLDVRRERLLAPDGRRVRPILEPPEGFAAALPPDHARLDPLDAEIGLELRTRLPAWILVISDRSSMAHGVEVRVPFLDERVVEHALAIPPAMKMQGLREKAVLRRAVADLLPPAITRRKKQPFATPIAPWFFSEGAPPFVDEALSERAVRDLGLFDPREVAALRAELAAAPPTHVDHLRRELVLSLVLGTQLLARQHTRGLDVPPARFAPKR